MAQRLKLIPSVPSIKARGWPPALRIASNRTSFRRDTAGSEEKSLAESPTAPFELVGEPDALPDAFFDALASLLLELEQSQKSQQDSKKECA
jgi:hypothetical protein